MSNTTTSPSSSGFLRAEDCHLEDLLEVIGAGTDLADYPHADASPRGCSSTTPRPCATR